MNASAPSEQAGGTRRGEAPPAGGAPDRVASARKPADSGPGDASDWPAKATALLESGVGFIRDRSVRPATQFVRYATAGIVLAVLVPLLAFTGALVVVRVLDVYAFRHHEWATDAIVGGALVAGGAVLFHLRNPKSEPAETDRA